MRGADISFAQGMFDPGKNYGCIPQYKGGPIPKIDLDEFYWSIPVLP